MLKSTDDFKLSGEETFISNPELNDQKKIEEIRNKMALIHQGFVVNLSDCKTCNESSNFYIINVTINSEINNIPVFGDIQLKLTKNIAQKFKTLLTATLAKNEPFSEESIIPIKKRK